MPLWVRWLWITLALLAGLYMGWKLLSLVLMVAVALVVTAALVPAVRWLDGHRVPHVISVAVSVLAVVGIFGGVLAYVVPVLVQQASQFAQGMPDLGRQLSWMETQWKQWRGQFPLIPQFADLTQWAVGQLSVQLERLIGLTGRFLTLVVATLTVLYLVFFFLKDGDELLDQVVGLLPKKARPEARVVTERVGVRVGHYVLGQMVVVVVDGVLTAIGLSLLGVPYAVLLGALVGVLAIVPFVGPVLGAIPGILLGLTISGTTALLAALVYWGVQQIEGYLVYPFVTGRFVRLHPVWIVLALLAGASLLGVVGAVLAVPAAATVAILVEEVYRPRMNEARPENSG